MEKEYLIEDLAVRTRDSHHVDARTTYFILCQRNTKFTLSQSAKLVDRNHATAIHAKKIYEAWVKFPQVFTSQINILEKIDALIQSGLEEISLEGDLLDIYRKKTVSLQEQVNSLLSKVEYQEKRIKELEVNELRY